jgi:hypothetical protein
MGNWHWNFLRFFPADLYLKQSCSKHAFEECTWLTRHWLCDVSNAYLKQANMMIRGGGSFLSPVPNFTLAWNINLGRVYRELTACSVGILSDVTLERFYVCLSKGYHHYSTVHSSVYWLMCLLTRDIVHTNSGALGCHVLVYRVLSSSSSSLFQCKWIILQF